MKTSVRKEIMSDLTKILEDSDSETENTHPVSTSTLKTLR